MEALIVGLLGLIGKLVQMGASAYADAQKKHDDLVAAVEGGLASAQDALNAYKADHAARMAEARAHLADLAAKPTMTTTLPSVPKPVDPTSTDPTSGT